MPGEQSNVPRQPLPRFQFSLRTLLGLIALGIYRRRAGLIVFGVFVLVGLRLGLDYSARRTVIRSWSGRRTGVVPVKVVDAVTIEMEKGAVRPR